MSEQKSLPRRGRSRYHHQQYQFSTNTTPRHHNSNKSNNNHTTNTATNTNTATSATSCPATGTNSSNKILSPRNGSGNLKSISSTFKSQDSIQCHIPTLVKSPSISTQQQKQFHKQQQQQQQNNKCSQNQTTSNQNSNAPPCSSSLKQQQPLLIQPKLHPLDPHSATHASNGQDGGLGLGLDGGGGVSTLASVVPVTCMPPSSQFRPIPHKSHEPHMSHLSSHPSHQHHHSGGGAGVGGVQAGTALLNPSTALLSSKFFTAPTLPLPK